jgi:hypothetical protein
VPPIPRRLSSLNRINTSDLFLPLPSRNSGKHRPPSFFLRFHTPPLFARGDGYPYDC